MLTCLLEYLLIAFIVGGFLLFFYYLWGIVMATAQQLKDVLTQVRDQNIKIASEVTSLNQKVALLTDQLANLPAGSVPDDLLALAEEVKAQTQGIDDLTADAVPEQPAPGPAVDGQTFSG